jgi:hypothetical protein
MGAIQSGATNTLDRIPFLYRGDSKSTIRGQSAAKT